MTVLVHCTTVINFHELKSSTAAYSLRHSAALPKNANWVRQEMKSLISFAFQPPGKSKCDNFHFMILLINLSKHYNIMPH